MTTSKKKIPPPVKHPAPFSDDLLAVIDRWIPDRATVLDPFAGTGRIHRLRPRVQTVGVEIEPEWAQQSPFTIVGSVFDMWMFPDRSFDVIATSVCFGNRFADHHDAKDGSVRRSYAHDLGRRLHPENAGELQWGNEYRDFHEKAWPLVLDKLKRRGLLILDISDHYRDGQRQPVTAWHVKTLKNLGLREVRRRRVYTKRLKYGQNRELRARFHSVILFEKP